MPKKKAAHKRQIKRRDRPVSSRAIYIAIPVLVIGLFITMNLSTTSPRQTAVLAATTTNHRSFFAPFTNFFSSLFSFLTSGHTTGTSNNSWFGGSSETTTQSTTNTALTQTQLESMAGDKYADGNLPLGDSKYTTDGPKKGYIYMCNVPPRGDGAEHAGSWLGSTTWTNTTKPTVEGSISWPNATFDNTISGNTRTLTGNGLPVGMTTGIFPISSSDPASQYDRNPNTITAQSINLQLPTTPTYSDTPQCMGMEVGMMTNGVSLFNGFDADLRDAAAHEVQDSCDGHPESNGQYHYHSLSRCFNNPSVQTVIGFALDGFPITGSEVSSGKYLTTDDLDECHGITSDITLDGKQVTMYHYVMTKDFPYSVSCFRGNPVSLQIIAGSHGQGGGLNNSGRQGMQQGGNSSGRTPPQAAITACSGKGTGTSCSFSGQNGTISGTCQTPPGQTSAVCVPANHQ